ncbi:MAG: ABC transporter ATP-binding protein [Alphaproteobacteria bacterium]|nr:MAG: ABC transporter ATP-binding protein [Alphaproteobacteria bacterium]
MTERAFTLADTCRRFWPFAKGQARLAAAIFVAALLTSGFAVLAPIPLKLVIDELLAGKTPGFLPPGTSPPAAATILAVAAALLATLAALFSALEKVLSARARERMTRAIRMACLERFMLLTPLCRGEDRQGELALRLVDDSQNVARLFAKTGPAILRHFLTFLMALAAMTWVDPLLGLLGVGIAIILAAIMRVAARPLSRAARAKRRQEGKVAASAQEILRLLDFVQASGSEGEIRAAFASTSDAALATGVEETTVAVRLERIMQIANGLALALIVGVGAALALQGAISAGGLAICVLYLNQMLKPLEKINDLASAVTGATSRAGRLAELLDRADMLDRSGNFVKGRARGSIRLDDVSFTYQSGREIAIGQVAIPCGSFVSVTGPSGAGKSTLFALLTRLFDPVSGTISLDDTSYHDWEIDALRRQFAIAPQSPPLLAGTVRDWLMLGNAQIREDACWRVLEAVALDKLIRLRGGLDAALGEGGGGFSGGEQARLSLARALLADRPVLLLDEPLANVDHRSADIILGALHREKGERTILVISHQPLPEGLVDQELVIGSSHRTETAMAGGES